jgi:phosphatidylglycerophosphatase A
VWPVRVATCGAIGYLPIPGTFGAAVGLGLVVAAARLHLPRAGSSILVGTAAAAVFGLGVWAAQEAEGFFAARDPRYVVIDEVVGQMVTYLANPQASWRWLLTGFVVFRILDVVKPFPARRAEHLPGGWGIMTDDVVAGLYSLAALLLLGFAIT